MNDGDVYYSNVFDRHRESHAYNVDMHMHELMTIITIRLKLPTHCRNSNQNVGITITRK